MYYADGGMGSAELAPTWGGAIWYRGTASSGGASKVAFGWTATGTRIKELGSPRLTIAKYGSCQIRTISALGDERSVTEFMAVA
jgi:hypothetical protein